MIGFLVLFCFLLMLYVLIFGFWFLFVYFRDLRLTCHPEKCWYLKKDEFPLSDSVCMLPVLGCQASRVIGNSTLLVEHVSVIQLKLKILPFHSFYCFLPLWLIVVYQMSAAYKVFKIGQIFPKIQDSCFFRQ